MTLFSDSLELLLLTVDALDADALLDVSALASAFFTARLALAVLLFTVALFTDKLLADESSSESFSSSILTTDLAVPTLRYLFCVMYPSAIIFRL